MSNITRCSCIICKNEMTVSGLGNHYGSKLCLSGLTFELSLVQPSIILMNCCYCQKECKNKRSLSHHERTCPLNPDRLYVNGMTGKTSWNKGLTKEDERIRKQGVLHSETVQLQKRNGTYIPRKHSDETKETIRKKALESKHRRLVRSIRTYTKVDGTTVQFDSSWEEFLAIRLDQLDIEWIRPGPLKWIDSSNKERNYFPDFYLPKFDLYLDPKNPIAMVQQSEKVEWLKKNISNVIFIETEIDCKNYLPIV